MPEARHVGAWIATASGADVEEYAIEVVDDRTVLCYISSEEHKEFMVRVKSELDGPETMLFRVNIDGHSLAGQVCNSGVEKYVDGVSVSNTLLRPFKFASWSTEDEESEAGCSSWHHVGLIEIRAYRVRIVEHTGILYHTRDVRTRPQREECQKAGVYHHFKLGDPVLSQRPDRCKVEYVDARDEPYARFQFRYRPVEVLGSLGLLTPPSMEESFQEDYKDGVLGDQSAHLVNSKRKCASSEDASPRPTRKPKQEPEIGPPWTPIGPVKPEDHDSIMTDESDLELEAMEERLRALQNAIQRKKAKRQSRTTVKRERMSPIRVPPSQTGGPIVIDLT